MRMPTQRIPVALLFVTLVCAGCAGPYVDHRERGTFRREAYPIVVVLPFETEGELSPELGRSLRDWVELQLLKRGFRLRPWLEVDQWVSDFGKGERKEAIFQACRALRIQGIWDARCRLEVDEEGRKELTLVLRLHNVETRDWQVELRGHHNADPGVDAAEERRVWVTLIRELIEEIPADD